MYRLTVKMPFFLEETNLIYLPSVVIEMILKELDAKDVFNVSSTCKFMHKTCQNSKFWKKFTVNVKTLLLDKWSCMKIAKICSEKGLTDLRIYFPRNDDDVEDMDMNDLDENVGKLLEYFQINLEALYLPIFMLTNSMNLLTTLQDFTNLKILKLGNHIRLFGEFKLWKQKKDITIKMLNILFTKLQNLEFFEIHDCHGLLEEPLGILANNNEKIKHLDASYCWSLERPGLLSLSNLHNLESLKLVCCGITDEDIIILTESCQELLDLNVGWTFVTDISLSNILKKIPSIMKLDVSGCKGITYDGMKEFTTKSRKLKKFFIRNAFNNKNNF